MIATLSNAFGFSGPHALLILALAALIGGLIRGFTGFGFAMVFVPIATIAVGPVKAAGLIWLVDIPFAWALAVAGWQRVAWREVAPLLIGAILFMPVGVWLLTHSDPVTARWAIAILILLGVCLLASGWRYRGAPSDGLSFTVGGGAGIASGLAQLGGMPIAIFWLASKNKNPRQTRDNLNGFFAVLPLATGLAYWWSGVINWSVMLMALPLMLPYALGLFVGTKLFPFASEQTFRRIAYVVIILAALLALPALDQLLGR